MAKSPRPKKAATPELLEIPFRCVRLSATMTNRGCLEYQVVRPVACKDCIHIDSVVWVKAMTLLKRPMGQLTAAVMIRQIRARFGMKYTPRRRRGGQIDVDDYPDIE